MGLFIYFIFFSEIITVGLISKYNNISVRSEDERMGGTHSQFSAYFPTDPDNNIKGCIFVFHPCHLCEGSSLYVVNETLMLHGDVVLDVSPLQRA